MQLCQETGQLHRADPSPGLPHVCPIHWQITQKQLMAEEGLYQASLHLREVSLTFICTFGVNCGVDLFPSSSFQVLKVGSNAAASFFSSSSSSVFYSSTSSFCNIESTVFVFGIFIRWFQEILTACCGRLCS